jgi:prephenate dehydrogenase
MGFDSVAVIGLGMVGGSFAAAVGRRANPPTLYGIDVDRSACIAADEMGLVSASADPDSQQAARWTGPGGVDLIVLATPAAVAEEWMAVLGERGYDGVVTDVASTKTGILDAARRHLGPDASYVGGHPMAGSERSGISAARPDLFDGAYYALTPSPETDMDAYRRVHSFVSSLGARVISVDATAHDEAVAIISHVPHVAAAALVDLAQSHAGEGDELLRLAAGGFKDTTRIAAGSPELWTGICIDNAEAVSDGLDELSRVLATFSDLVRAGDEKGVRAWLEDAADVRRSLPAQWVPATEDLTELLIPVSDRPGVISEVTSAVGRYGCNIEAIEIDHQSEDTAVLVLVLTDEGDMRSLVTDLGERGFDPRLRPLEE